MAVTIDVYFPVRVTTIAERDALPNVEGLKCFVSNTNSDYIYTSGTWVLTVSVVNSATQTALDLKLDDTQFSGLSKITVSATEPVAPAVGDLWVDTN